MNNNNAERDKKRILSHYKMEKMSLLLSRALARVCAKESRSPHVHKQKKK